MIIRWLKDLWIKTYHQRERRTYMNWPSLTHIPTLYNSLCQEIPHQEEINSQLSSIIQLPKQLAQVDRVHLLLGKTMMKTKVSFLTTLQTMTFEASLRTNIVTIWAAPYPKVWYPLQEVPRGLRVTTTFLLHQVHLCLTLVATQAPSDWWSTRTQVMEMKMIYQMRTMVLKVKCPRDNRTTWSCINRILWWTLNILRTRGKYFQLKTMMIWVHPHQMMMMMRFKDNLREVKAAIQIIHLQVINLKPKIQCMGSSPQLSSQEGITQVDELNNINQTNIYRSLHSVIDYMSFW